MCKAVLDDVVSLGSSIEEMKSGGVIFWQFSRLGNYLIDASWVLVVLAFDPIHMWYYYQSFQTPTRPEPVSQKSSVLGTVITTYFTWRGSFLHAYSI